MSMPTSLKSPIGETVELPLERDSQESSNGYFNLIRAAAETAQKMIDKIEQDLEKLEFKKQELNLERSAHIELRDIGQKYLSALAELKQNSR